MFGLSFGEITLLLIVGIVVVGPKNLPSMMRTAGQWIAKLRRMSTDLRAQSGIDELIRLEGLEREIAELRSLTRMNVVDSLITPAISPALSHAVAAAPPRPALKGPEVTRDAPLREREYPLLGCDAEGALPDDAVIYAPPIAPEPAPELAPEPTTALEHAPPAAPENLMAPAPELASPAAPENFMAPAPELVAAPENFMAPAPAPELVAAPAKAPEPLAAPARLADTLAAANVAGAGDAGAPKAQPEPLHADERREGSAL